MIPSAWRPRPDLPFGIKEPPQFVMASCEPYTQKWVELRAHATPDDAFSALSNAKLWARHHGGAVVLQWYRDYRGGDPFAPSPYQAGNQGLLKNGWLSMIVHYRAVEILCGRIQS